MLCYTIEYVYIMMLEIYSHKCVKIVLRCYSKREEEEMRL